MYLLKTILILEDDLRVLSKLLDRLFHLENDQVYHLAVIVLTTSTQVEEYINSNQNAQFDVIILDRDCKISKSFHVLDIERFGAEKVISISTVPEYNQAAQKRGVKRVVLKDQQHLDVFADKVVQEVRGMITPSRLLRIKQLMLD